MLMQKKTGLVYNLSIQLKLSEDTLTAIKVTEELLSNPEKCRLGLEKIKEYKERLNEIKLSIKGD